jgi:ATP-dependent Clp protease ATP-binding subunit ClpA
VYERYTQPARRAVFFAAWHARLRESAEIDSVDLLRGLMHDDDSRVNTVFGLRERFPVYDGDPSKFATAEEVPKAETMLTNEAKRCVAWAAQEADGIGDYWIDTEHLLLGIMHEPRCLAAQFLAKTGLTLRSARATVLQNKGSRPDYGSIPEGWAVQSAWSWLLSKLRRRG